MGPHVSAGECGLQHLCVEHDANVRLEPSEHLFHEGMEHSQPEELA